MNGSLRYTDYDSYGSDNTYKFGVMYSPIDWFSVRVTQGTSFRAPALFEQFQGATSGFLSQAGDPCNNYGAKGANPVRAANCASEGPSPTFVATSGIRVFSEGGAAAGLEAETSDNLTYGFILQPELGDAGDSRWRSTTSTSRSTTASTRPAGRNILKRCYDDPEFRAGGGFCKLVTRNPATYAADRLERPHEHRDAARRRHRLHDSLRARPRPGLVPRHAQATHYLEQANKLFEDDELDQLNGTINNPEERHARLDLLPAQLAVPLGRRLDRRHGELHLPGGRTPATLPVWTHWRFATWTSATTRALHVGPVPDRPLGGHRRRAQPLRRGAADDLAGLPLPRG